MNTIINSTSMIKIITFIKYAVHKIPPPPPSPKIRQLINKTLSYIYEKCVRKISLSPVPRLEVFALPGSIERATKKPHAECIISIYIHQKHSETTEYNNGCTCNIQTREHLPLHLSCYYLRSCEVPRTCMNKAQ